MKRIRTAELPCFLYVLEDPREPGNFRYIGLTQSPPSRLAQHCSRARQERQTLPDLEPWIQSLFQVGLEPRMRILWTGDLKEAGEREFTAIEGYRRLGFSLLNRADGGFGAPGVKLSDAHRAALSRSLKGRRHSEAQRVATSLRMKGKPAWNKGKPMSLEQRQKLSAAKKGTRWTEARRKSYENRYATS